MTTVLEQLAAGIASGDIRTIDLTQTLSPDTPTLVLPPEFNQCAGFSKEEISRYDERGVAWYWNNFTVSEHTGTHFDAPIHWASGKDLPNNAADTIPPADFLAPAVVIDISRQSAAAPAYLLTVADIAATRAVLAGNGVATEDGAAGGLWVRPEHAHGSVISFIGGA